MAQKAVEPWLVEAAKRRVAGFTEALRTVDDTSVSVPNLEWSVATLAQHVACLPSFWDTQHDLGSDFVRPADFGAFADQARAHIIETDAGQLADLIEAEFEDFISKLADDPQRWLYGVETAASNMLGLVINETVIHGMDLAAVTGTLAPTFEEREAHVAVSAMMTTTPCFIDEDRAKAQPDGVYHVSFKGGKDYTWTKAGGTLSITEGKPDKPDARMKADPTMFLLSSLGRVSQIKAGLSGKMMATGRRPWRFLSLPKMVIDDV